MTLSLSSGQVSLLKWGTSGSTSGLQCKEDWCGNELRISLSMLHAQSHFCTDPSLENIFLFHWPSLWVSGAGPLAPCVSAGYQSQVSFGKMAMSHLDLIIPIFDLRGSPNGTYKMQLEHLLDLKPAMKATAPALLLCWSVVLPLPVLSIVLPAFVPRLFPQSRRPNVEMFHKS